MMVTLPDPTGKPAWGPGEAGTRPFLRVTWKSSKDYDENSVQPHPTMDVSPVSPDPHHPRGLLHQKLTKMLKFHENTTFRLGF